MNISYRTDKDILYISVSGRIDASNSSAADSEISTIRAEHKDLHTVIDADCLEYISSAGLRVILKILKEEPKLAIINVSPEIYEVLDMTGFTEMVTVEKAFRKMSIDGCEFIAKGANGAVYRYDNETILKIYFAKDALPEIRQERENARKAFVLGINTAIPYGIVRVGEGYGTVTELLNAQSVTKIIMNDPDDLELPVKYYTDMLKSIHAIEVEPGEVTDMKAVALEWAELVGAHIDPSAAKKLTELISSVPDRNTLIHGDYHTNNIMVQNDEPILIDMDTLSAGHPVFELGSMYNAFKGFPALDHSITEKFFGYSYETGNRFWEMSVKKYLGTDDEKVLLAAEDKAKVIGFTRLLRRAIRHPEEAESADRIVHFKNQLEELLTRVDTLDF